MRQEFYDSGMMVMAKTIGQSALRTEDKALLTGRGRYTGDLASPYALQVVFVRSPHAHARITHIDPSLALEMPGVVAVLTAATLHAWGIGPIRATSELPAYQVSDWYPLADGESRFVGEAVAAVLARDRYVAEDAAELVDVQYESLPPVVDPVSEGLSAARLTHTELSTNVLVERLFEAGDADQALESSAITIPFQFRTHRVAGSPLEGRGVNAWPERHDALVVETSTQVPHIIRHGLALVTGIAEDRIRVIAPDVGGGFGVKSTLYPEECVVAAAAHHLGRPVSWLEDRREHLLSSTHGRDHHYEGTLGADQHGRLTALDLRIVCDVGAYSIYPWTAGIEPLMAGGLLPGPYKLDHYRCQTMGVATNKCPSGPYRGVARPATTFVMERLMDMLAVRTGLDPVDVRRRNLIRPEDIPYKSATRVVHDSPAYLPALEAVLEHVDYSSLRAQQRRAQAEGRRIGIGLACYNELTGLGSKASAGPRMPMRTGHEGATLRVDPSGRVTLLLGVTSQGQGLYTTMAQVAAEELGVPLDAITVRLGDTAESTFGFGAFASRQAVIGGGAVIRAARDLRSKILRVAAHMLEASVEDLDMADSRIWVRGAEGHGTTLREVALCCYHRIHELPRSEEPGLEVTRFYDPEWGSFAGGAQLAVVEVDQRTGLVKILRYVCAEDSGRQINPRIVEGQVIGAIAQGIGEALLEQVRYDDAGQLLTGSFVDYLMPAMGDIPRIELVPIEFPSNTLGGFRGVGEGGTLGPPAALGNALADALGPEAKITEIPLAPTLVLKQVRDRHR